MTPIERMARILCKNAVFGGASDAYVDRAWRRYVNKARETLAALKYADGTDESRLIDVAAKFRMDPVCLAQTWDAMIDAILAEPTGA